ncbi:ABC transporter ATP-binding protein [Herbiconiux liukaitaii]|uniref:ABC transporter ATP-binding protein n=1 Tax=Herbiconiux liukaitaii TaxID=3342799 RepID=UPI0035B8A35F
MSSNPEPILRVAGITKAFGPVVANADVSFELRAGEVHALVGENGAGKSTLMNILYGLHLPDSGTIEVEGLPVSFSHPRDAIRAGIGMVHQHFTLVPEFSVLENVALGDEVSRFGMVQESAIVERLQLPLRMLGMPIDLGAKTGSLSVATQQRIEILKVLYRGARIMILDEPTAVLTPQECVGLFDTLRTLADEGFAVVFISHKLREVMEIADRVTVLRGGRTVVTLDRRATTIPELVAAMTGRETVNLGRVPRAAPTPRPLLEVKGLSGGVAGDASLVAADLVVHQGEIVGVAGIDGNGQNSLFSLLTGTSRAAGSIELDGNVVTHSSIAGRRSAGLASVPEDRHREGLPVAGSVFEALLGGRLARTSVADGLKRSRNSSNRGWADELVRRFSIKTSSSSAACSSLSGGNQQKVVIARELAGSPRCVVLAQPTRGVDLGAADFVYATLAEHVAAGNCAVVISADLDELIRLSDRILVLFRGVIVAERRAESTTREELGHYMTGGASADAA